MKLRSLDRFHSLAVTFMVTGVIYIVWLSTVLEDTVSVVFYILEALIILLAFLFIHNHWDRRYTLKGGPYSMRAIVDVYITTKNEDIEVLEETVKSATEIYYYNKRVYILDDGDREEVQQLAQKYDCRYIVRPDRTKKRYKAANLNYAFSKTHGNFILTIDADTVIKPTILDDLLGHFKDPKVGLVSSRQRFEVDKDDFNNDNVFYEYMQTGKNWDGAAISCGSGVIYRRKALNDIGGFQEWNLVEDLYTSYRLNTAGYKNVYANQSYTLGDAPTDLGVIYKQRGNWAFDTLRMWIWKAPLLNKKLTWSQRFHYFEIGYIYFVSGVVIPSIYLLNIYSMLFADPIVEVGIWYLVYKIPSFVVLLWLYNSLGQGASSSRMWAALFPVYFWAFARALMYRKPEYKPTLKKVRRKYNIAIILPQFLFIIAGVASIVFHIINYGETILLGVNLFWFIVMVYWLYPVFDYTFGPEKSVHSRSLQTSKI